MKVVWQKQIFGNEKNSDAFFICKMVKN
jgi:hypothetical protein